MKRVFTFWGLMILSSVSFICKGQCPSNKGQFEVTVSQGFLTGGQVADQVAANDNSAASSGGKTETYNSGAVFITARYFLFNRLAFGFSGGVTGQKGRYTDFYTPSVITSTYKQSNTTVAMELYYIYYFRKYLEFYTLFGIGPSFATTITTTYATSVAAGTTVTSGADALKLQYTPIGIRLGGRIGAFAELGFGYKGIFNVGASFKLGPSCWWVL